MILLKERKTLSRCNDHFPVRRLQLSGKNLQKSRFSGPVGANQSITVAFGEFDRYVFKQRFFPNAKCDIICTDHSVSFSFT